MVLEKIIFALGGLAGFCLLVFILRNNLFFIIAASLFYAMIVAILLDHLYPKNKNARAKDTTPTPSTPPK